MRAFAALAKTRPDSLGTAWGTKPQELLSSTHRVPGTPPPRSVATPVTMRSYVPSSYRGHRARVAFAAAQDGQGGTSKPLPLCGLPGVPTSAARSHRRPPTDKEKPLNSPNPPRSLVSRSLVALVSPTGRHSGFQTVPRKGSTDEKRGGGRTRAAPLFFFSGAPRSLTPSSFGPGTRHIL